MKKFVKLALLVFAISGWHQGPAIAQTSQDLEFTCRYFGRDYKIGAQICLATPTGLRRALCDMELNNSAWKVSPSRCTKATEIKPRISSKAQNYVEKYIREHASDGETN